MPVQGLSTYQSNLIAGAYKEVDWLFKITTTAGTVYRWSTKSVPAYADDPPLVYDPTSGQFTSYLHGYQAEAYYAWAFKVYSFDGVEIRRGSSENGIQAPSELIFKVSNKSNALTASSFTGAELMLSLRLYNGTYREVVRRWRFYVHRVEGYYQSLIFHCEDFLQHYLKGDYPKTKLASGIWLSSGKPFMQARYTVNAPKTYVSRTEDNYCVPVPFGTCYIPIRPLYVPVDNAVFYLLGPVAPQYTISEVRSPRESGQKSTWSSGGYTFNQYNKSDGVTTWKVATFIIADSDGDGTADANGVWQNGSYLHDALVEFYRSDTQYTTNPARVVQYVLADMGVPVGLIDANSFAAAATTYASWGLTFNGAYYTKQPSEKVLSQLLNQCHATLIVDENIKIQILSKTSQGTINNAYVLRDSFSFTLSEQELSDSGYVAFQISGEPQDVLDSVLTPAKADKTVPSSETLECPFVQSADHCQRLASMYFQRRFLVNGTVSFETKSTLLNLNPDDIITVNHANYGASIDVLIDQIKITKDLRLLFQGVTFSDTLDDFTDLSFAAPPMSDDTTTSYWKPVLTGPNSTVSTGTPPNKVDETAVFIGDKLALNGVGDGYVAMLDGSGNAIVKVGTVSGTEGLYIYKSDGTPVARYTKTDIVVGDVSLNYANLYFDTTDGLRLRQGLSDKIKLDMSGNAYFSGSIEVANTSNIHSAGKTSYADTDAGFFIGYDTDAYKINIGDANSYFKWTGSALEIKVAVGETVDVLGSVNINVGGDLTLQSDGDDYSFIEFFNSGGDPICGVRCVYNDTPPVSWGLFIAESTGETDPKNLYLGSSPNPWNTVTIASDSLLYFYGTGIQVQDDDWIGLGASAARIVFDDQTTDEICFEDCYVGIRESSPLTALHVTDGVSAGASPVSGTVITAESGSACYIQLLGAANSAMGLIAGDATNNAATFLYDHSADNWKWKVNGNYELYLTGTLLYPGDAAGLSLGSSTYYFNDIQYKTLTDAGCLGWFDEGVELQDGSKVSDVEALQNIKKHPFKETVYGVPMLDYKSMPKACYKPARGLNGSILERDENDEPFEVVVKRDELGNEITKIEKSSDGAEISSLISIMLGAIKELDDRLKKGGL
jgi:hypothetical protein